VNQYARLKVFSILYGVAYMASFLYSESCQCAWFRYYPALGEFSSTPLPLAEAGLPINWYSWLLIGFLVAAVGALITPRRLAERLPHSWVWGVAAATLVVIMVYERRWFY
jgi:hypothetical protein